MSHRVDLKDIKEGTFYLVLFKADKTAEIILTGKAGQEGYYFLPGVASDFPLSNLTDAVIFQIPIPEGYKPL